MPLRKVLWLVAGTCRARLDDLNCACAAPSAVSRRDVQYFLLSSKCPRRRRARLICARGPRQAHVLIHGVSLACTSELAKVADCCVPEMVTMRFVVPGAYSPFCDSLICAPATT
jgi:hypothetical protein